MGPKLGDCKSQIHEGTQKYPTLVVPTATTESETIAASPPEAVPAATDVSGSETHVPVARSAGRTVLTPSQIAILSKRRIIVRLMLASESLLTISVFTAVEAPQNQANMPASKTQLSKTR